MNRMNTMMIVAVVVIVVALAAGYMFMSGGSYTLPASTGTDAATPSGSAVTSNVEGNIDAVGSASVATDAEAAVTETAGELGSVDNLDIPDVQ